MKCRSLITLFHLLLLNQFLNAWCIPFRHVSEFSLFQHSFVTVEDINEGVLHQHEVSRDGIQRGTDDANYPGFRGLLTSCQNSSSPTETQYNQSDSNWCGAFGKKLSFGRFIEEIEKMRSFDFPLAHAYRPYIAMEVLAKLLLDAEISASTDRESFDSLRGFRQPDQYLRDASLRNSPIDKSAEPLSFFHTEEHEHELKPSSKSLLKLNVLDITGITLIALACTIAVCVGVGGGGMFVPILILMLGFTTHESTGLAQSLMVGGTLAGLVLNWNQRHPVANRPLIDVTMVLLLGPMQIAGANLGVIINHMLPSWLIIGFTVLVLGFTGFKTFVKGVEAYQRDCEMNNLKEISPDNRTPQQEDHSMRSSFDETPPSRIRIDYSARSPISGLSDCVVTQSATQMDRIRAPSSFSEAVSVLGSQDNDVPNFDHLSYHSILLRHHRDRHCQRSPSSSIDPKHRTSTDGPIRRVGDLAVMSMVSMTGENGGQTTAIVRTYHPLKRNEELRKTKANQDKGALNEQSFHGCLSSLPEEEEQFMTDETIGILYSEKQIDQISQNLLSSEHVESRPRSHTTVPNRSNKSPSLSPPVFEDLTQRHRTLSSCSSPMFSPMFKLLSYTPLRYLIPPSAPSMFNAIYNDAMSRYVQVCMAEDAPCIVLDCCLSNRDLIGQDDLKADQTIHGLENWDTPLLNGKNMRFRICFVDKRVSVIDQFRLSRFDIESSNLSIELVEVRPLFLSSDDCMREPKVSAVFMTKINRRGFALPAPVLHLDGYSDLENENIKKEAKEGVKEGVKESSKEEGTVEDSYKCQYLNIHQSSAGDVVRVISSASTEIPSKVSSPYLQRVSPSVHPTVHPIRRVSIMSTRNMEKILRREESRQYDKWLVLLLIWGINSVLILTRGGKSNSGLVSFCGVSYWVISSTCIVLPAIASLFIGSYAIRLTNLKLSLDVPFVQGELVYTKSCVFQLLIQTFAAGVAAGVVGIGGGMILGPMMLSEGVSPQVTTAVNSTLVLFASSSAALNFMISGQADPIWSSFLFVICFCSSLIGKYALDQMIKRYNLSSALVFLLLLIIVLSMLSMLVSGVLDVVAFGITGFSSPCA